MKRKGNDDFRRYGPAAAALRRGHVFRDAREAKEQITAAGIIQDAVAMNQFCSTATASKKAASACSDVLQLHSREELALYRQKKREEMEIKVVRGGKFIGNWIKYARWEAQQGSMDRMRAVFERGLAMHGLEPSIWRDYAELESLYGFVEEARGVLERAVKLLPASVDLWLKYLVLELAAAPERRGGGRVQELFRRWCSIRDAPSCAFELYAFHEGCAAASGELPNETVRLSENSKEATRAVLRRYVEVFHCAESWFFYSLMERHLLKDSQRQREVLRTAIQLLPTAQLYGPVDYRIPLALAESLEEAGEIEEARAVYRDLLQQTQGEASKSLHEDLFAAYRRFERLHAKNTEDAAYVHFAEAHKRYLSQLEAMEKGEGEALYDYDAALSFYALLRQERRRLLQGASETEASASSQHHEAKRIRKDSSPIDKETVKRLEEESVDVLERASSRLPPPTALVSCQQHAALLVTLVSRILASVSSAGSAAAPTALAMTTRGLLAKAIQQFPFDRAQCADLWIKAAALEEFVFDTPEQSRRLLTAGFAVTKETEVLEALLNFESRTHEKAVASLTVDSTEEVERRRRQQELQEGYLQRVRRIYQSSIEAAPLLAQRWIDYAMWELKQAGAEGSARAAVLYRQCIRTLSAEARKLTLGLSERYHLLEQVDSLWGRLVALERRPLRKLLRSLKEEKRETPPSEATLNLLEHHTTRLNEVSAELVSEVVDGYRETALVWCWAYQGDSADGRVRFTSTPPTQLPEVVKPAILRLTEAFDATIQIITGDVAPAMEALLGWRGTFTEKATAPALIRALFKKIVSVQRSEVFKTLAARTSESFEEMQGVQAWRDLLLRPLLHEWGKYEALTGGHPEAVSEAYGSGSGTISSRVDAAIVGAGSAPTPVVTRKRTRLFKTSD